MAKLREQPTEVDEAAALYEREVEERMEVQRSRKARILARGDSQENVDRNRNKEQT